MFEDGVNILYNNGRNELSTKKSFVFKSDLQLVSVFIASRMFKILFKRDKRNELVMINMLWVACCGYCDQLNVTLAYVVLCTRVKHTFANIRQLEHCVDEGHKSANHI